MKLLALLLALVCSAFGADQKADVAALLERSKQFSNANSQASFQLEGKFKLYGTVRGTIEGDYAHFRTREQSRTDVSVGGYVETQVRQGDKVYLASNSDVGSIVLADLIDVFARIRRETHFGNGAKITTREVNGVRLACIDEKKSKMQQCYRDDGALLMSTSRDGNYEYDDYADIGQMKLPRHITIEKDGFRKAELWITGIVQKVPEPQLFVPPNGVYSASFDLCKQAFQEPKAIKTPDPEFPAAARGKPSAGSTTLDVVISPKGAPTAIRLLKSSLQSFDRSALEVIRQWKFQPATCNGRPISWHTYVEFRYSAY